MAHAVTSNFQVDYHERHDLTGSISIRAKKKLSPDIWVHDRGQSTSRVGSNLCRASASRKNLRHRLQSRWKQFEQTVNRILFCFVCYSLFHSLYGCLSSALCLHQNTARLNMHISLSMQRVAAPSTPLMLAPEIIPHPLQRSWHFTWPLMHSVTGL